MSTTTKAYRVSHEVHPYIFFGHILESIDADDFWESESVSTSGDESEEEAKNDNVTLNKEECHWQVKGRLPTKRDSQEEDFINEGLSLLRRKTKRTKKNVANAAA